MMYFNGLLTISTAVMITWLERALSECGPIRFLHWNKQESKRKMPYPSLGRGQEELLVQFIFSERYVSSLSPCYLLCDNKLSQVGKAKQSSKSNVIEMRTVGVKGKYFTIFLFPSLSPDSYITSLVSVKNNMSPPRKYHLGEYIRLLRSFVIGNQYQANCQ